MSKERKPAPGLDPVKIKDDRDAKRLKRLVNVRKSLEQYLNVVYLDERQQIEELINDLTPEIERLTVAQPPRTS